MIIIKAANYNWTLTPTMFPDGTSQVWKLPEGIVQCSSVDVEWRFDSEREIIDLLSLSKLLKNQLNTLHIPYLPYARQDKEISNTSTFNLEVFADLVNMMGFTRITSFDVHNPYKTENLIDNFHNIGPNEFHEEVVAVSKPDFIVFPDAGAAERYCNSGIAHIPKIVCDKVRDQMTGKILGHRILNAQGSNTYLGRNSVIRVLIIDDLCDGGATFVSVASMLRSQYDLVNISLCVSHGLFSKGRDHILNNGIDNLYTTNSLTKNEDGFNV